MCRWGGAGCITTLERGNDQLLIWNWNYPCPNFHCNLAQSRCRQNYFMRSFHTINNNPSSAMPALHEYSTLAP